MRTAHDIDAWVFSAPDGSQVQRVQVTKGLAMELELLRMDVLCDWEFLHGIWLCEVCVSMPVLVAEGRRAPR